MQRIILHMDLDSFYASVEELRNPEMKGKPVAICVFSGRSADSGAVASANYKARDLGIHAGMPIFKARKMATPDTHFLQYDIEYYRDVSDRIMDLLEDFCDILEQAGIDEAYLDVTKRAQGNWKLAEEIALNIKSKILEQENLTCSIGIGPNKLIAKIAGKLKKPDGLTTIESRQVEEFMADMPISKIHGIGTKTSDSLIAMGIRKAKDLLSFNPLILEEKFGKNKMQLLLDKAAGIDNSAVEQKEAQQISKMGTLKRDTRDVEEIFAKIMELSPFLKRKIEKKDVAFRTISIILIDNNLGTQTRGTTLGQTQNMDFAMEEARKLLVKYLEENENVIRRAGIRVSNLVYEKQQRTLGEF